MGAVADRVIRGDGTPESEWLEWTGLSRLPQTSVDELVPPGARAVIVAPHPDDEVLSVGGLIAQLARAGVRVRIVAVTDGTASHQGSTQWPADRLQHERPRESRLALARLGVDERSELIRLGLPDGSLRDVHNVLAERLLPLMSRDDVVFTTWRQDGHPDHEAVGHACAFAAARAGARLIEVPVWAWHWAQPGDDRLPWRRAVRLPLDSEAVARKQRAVRAFASQLEVDASTGADPILRGSTLDRVERPFEVMWL